MSHDARNPFSNETGEYLQELQEIDHSERKPESESKESAPVAQVKRAYNKRK